MAAVEVHVKYRKVGERPSWAVGIYRNIKDKPEWQSHADSIPTREGAMEYARQLAQNIAYREGNGISVHADKPENGVQLIGAGTGKTLEKIVCADGTEYDKRKVYRVKLQRVVVDEVEFYVEADSVQDILDKDTRDKLVDYADRQAYWDGETVGLETVLSVTAEVDPGGDSVLRLGKV